MRDDVHIRLTLTRGVKVTSGMDPRLNTSGPTLIVLAEHKAPVYGSQPIRLMTSSIRRFPPDCMDPKIHHNNLIQSILAKIEANAAGADDALMLDRQGFVAETNATHVFLVRDGVVVTSHCHACPEGVTRSTVLELCRNHGIPHEVADFTQAELYRADEAFCTGTMGELVAVAEVDGRPIGGAVRPVLERLQGLFPRADRRERLSHPGLGATDERGRAGEPPGPGRVPAPDDGPAEMAARAAAPVGACRPRSLQLAGPDDEPALGRALQRRQRRRGPGPRPVAPGAHALPDALLPAPRGDSQGVRDGALAAMALLPADDVRDRTGWTALSHADRRARLPDHPGPARHRLAVRPVPDRPAAVRPLGRAGRGLPARRGPLAYAPIGGVQTRRHAGPDGRSDPLRDPQRAAKREPPRLRARRRHGRSNRRRQVERRGAGAGAALRDRPGRRPRRRSAGPPYRGGGRRRRRGAAPAQPLAGARTRDVPAPSRVDRQPLPGATSPK